MTERVTRVARDWARVRFPLFLAGLCVVVGGYFLFRTVHARGRDAGRVRVFASLFVLAGVGSFVFAAKTSGRAECPACDLWLHGLSLDENVRLCPHCSRYVEGKGGQLSPTPEDAVAAEPRYRTFLPQGATGEGVVFPAECAVCQRPSERRVDLEVVLTEDAAFHTDMAVRAASLGTLKAVERRSIHVAVPHCRQHDDGARLDAAALDANMAGPFIVFRSHRALRRFCDLNGTTPV